MKKTLITLFALILIGCSPVTVSETTPVVEGFNMSRYIDKEAGVVCWVYYRDISCLPIEYTLLENKR